MTFDRKNARDIYPPTGPERTAKSWQTEAAMRMLMNNLHPDVAENPHELVVYGGIGRAARTWEAFDRIVAGMKDLEADGFVLRTAHQVVPPHVDYELTELGTQAAGHVVALVGWIEGALPRILAGQRKIAAE